MQLQVMETNPAQKRETEEYNEMVENVESRLGKEIGGQIPPQPHSQTPPQPHPQTHLRNVAHIAASQLENKGYTVIKAATRSWPYDLVAFNQQQMLLIATRRHTKQQSAKQILQIYQDLISDMQCILAPPGSEKQIWVYQNGYGFSVYKLFQNGIMKKE